MNKSSELLFHAIESGLSKVSSVTTLDDGFRVTTHCMYPSNGLVRVSVRGGAHEVVISDDGEAVGEALSAGVPVRDANNMLSSLVKDLGLKVVDGVISTGPMPTEAVALGVLLVANAARDVASWLYENSRIKRTRDFPVLGSKRDKRHSGVRVYFAP